MNTINAVDAAILQWLTEWSKKVKPFAEDPEHHLRFGETRTKYQEQLRFATRLPDWDSDIVYWYYVQYAQNGRRFRVLAIHMSQYCHKQTAALASEEASIARAEMRKREVKDLWFRYWKQSGIFDLFFPLHTSVGFQLVTTEPRLVMGKRENLTSFRFGVEWSILVPDESTAGYGGAVGDARQSSPLVDQHGNPFAAPIENLAARDNARRFENQVLGNPPPELEVEVPDDRKVIPLGRAQRRRAEREKKKQ